jgi:hypothetical protein
MHSQAMNLVYPEDALISSKGVCKANSGSYGWQQEQAARSWIYRDISIKADIQYNL